MPPVPKAEIFQKILRALEQGGVRYLIESQDHPFVVRLLADGAWLRVRSYVWNITHGGGAARNAKEYRIQVTSVPEFVTAGVDRTVVLGWWEDGEVFAAWDVEKHLGALGASPSLQVREETLEQARRDLMAAQEKDNGEIVLALEPSALPLYLTLGRGIHSFGAHKKDLAVIRSAMADPDQGSDLASSLGNAERKRVVVQVSRALRASGFARRVLAAYSHRCAMCRIQLRLIDAAHIVPVEEQGTDEVRNGVALCALHHRAYDAALVTFDEQYRVLVNPVRLAQLADENRAGGEKQFRNALYDRLVIPPGPGDRPEGSLIKKANTLRGWRKYEAA